MTLYFARRSGFGYGEVTELDREQVIELQGHRNDEKLVRLGYLAEVPSRTTLCPCGVCGAAFLTPSTLSAHGMKRHPDRFSEVTDPREEDRRRAEEERINNTVAPLYLDQTEASRKDGPNTVISSPKPAAPVADPPKRKRGRPPKQVQASA